MKRRGPRTGFALIELLAVVAVGGVLLAILGRLLIDAFVLQRGAAEHADRVAVITSLTRYLRKDTLGAVAAEWSADTLRLEVLSDGEAANVVYVLTPDCVQRLGPGSAERAWQATRLQFATRSETGPRGTVWWLECTEEPPLRRTPVVARTYDIPFLLPPAADGFSACREVVP